MCRLLWSFFVKIQGSGNSLPRSLGQLHKKFLHINKFLGPSFLVIQLALALHFLRASINLKGSDNVVHDFSNVPVVAPPPGSRSLGPRGESEGLRQVGWGTSRLVGRAEAILPRE